ncbi:hypothetical protein LXL04_034942 [Taraxacum kok-saghyz]
MARSSILTSPYLPFSLSSITHLNQNSREGTNPNRRAASNPIITREGTIRFFKSRILCSIFQPVNLSALQSRTEEDRRLICLSKLGSVWIAAKKNPPALALCPATNNYISTSENISDLIHYAPPWVYWSGSEKLSESCNILIVDWDVHHGNGTQKAFWNNCQVLFFSVHSFYPCGDDGSHMMVGEGEGEGYNINVPWENGGCGDADYIAVWDHILIPVAKEFKPDIILISAGFDSALGDPLGGCCITPNGYAIMLKKILYVLTVCRCIEVAYVRVKSWSYIIKRMDLKHLNIISVKLQISAFQPTLAAQDVQKERVSCPILVGVVGKRPAAIQVEEFTAGVEAGMGIRSGKLHRLPMTNFTYHSTIKSLPAANSPKSEKILRGAYVASFASANFTYHSDQSYT